MRTLPAILWYLELTRGSEIKDRLVFTGDWRLASIEGAGAPPVEHNAHPVFQINGSHVTSYNVQPRPLVLGVFYRGARNQRDFYAARRRLLDFVRPNQHTPVRLYVVLPSGETLYLDVYASPGAPLPLGEDRGRTFLEPVNITAYNPIWESTKILSGEAIPSGFDAAYPTKATVSTHSDEGSVSYHTIRLQLGLEPNAEDDPFARLRYASGFYLDWKKHGTTDSYVRENLKSEEEFTLTNLEDNVQYEIIAAAYSSRGRGPFSDILTQYTPLELTEETSLSIVEGVRSFTVSWDAITNATGYQVRYKLVTDADWNDWSTSSTNTSYTASSLNSGAAYHAQVRYTVLDATNMTIYSPPYTTGEVTTRYRRPGRPRNGEVISHTKIEFDAPNSGGPVTHYIASVGNPWHSRPVSTTLRRAGEHQIGTATLPNYPNPDTPNGSWGGNLHWAYVSVRAYGPGGRSGAEEMQGFMFFGGTDFDL